MTRVQLDAWKRVPLAVNMQPDISRVGNREVQALALEAGCWMRTDSVLVEEPVQVGSIADRPATTAAIIEDGYYRRYERDATAAAGLERTMLHALDMGANYWSLWTEADNLASWGAEPGGTLERVRARLGYRVRPAWVWQRKGGPTGVELVVAVANDGVAGIPGTLRLAATAPDGRALAAGPLDPGHPHAGRLRLAALPLPPGAGAGAWREVRLRAEIEMKGGVRRPVRWACRETAADGSVAVPLALAGDPAFRKGV